MKKIRRIGEGTYSYKNLTSREVAEEVFHSIKEKKSIAEVETIKAEFTGKAEKRLHLNPLFWLLEKGVFNANVTHNLEWVVASLKAKIFEGQPLARNLWMGQWRRLSNNQWWRLSKSLQSNRYRTNRIVKQSYKVNSSLQLYQKRYPVDMFIF